MASSSVDRSAKYSTLFYKDTCPPCQRLSGLVVVFSLGVIRRVAMSSTEAKAFYRQFPEYEGQLVLVEGQRYTFGPKVFAAVPRVITITWWHALVDRIRFF